MGVKEGDTLAGKYRVEKLLGMGGMGAVVAAHHVALDQRVAIKFLLPEALRGGEAVGRFVREARAATRIKSEHVVRIIDVASFESGEPYMVMEYLEGRDLGAVVREDGPLPVSTAADYLLQACEALAEAHTLGIIHRDLKPANLFLTRRMDGTALVKVLDFGISKVTGTGSTGPELALTKTTGMMGSPLYMSPEQMSSARDVDVRTDIWALGVILYELVAGVPPFNAEMLPQLCAMVLQREPEPIRSLRPDVPLALDTLIARCLRKSPADRYASVAELAIALGELAPKQARASVKRICAVVHATELGPATSANPASPTETPALGSEQGAVETAVAWGESRSPARGASYRVLAAGALVVALGLVAVIGFGVHLTRKSAPAAAESEVQAAASPAEASGVPAFEETAVAAEHTAADPAPPVSGSAVANEKTPKPRPKPAVVAPLKVKAPLPDKSAASPSTPDKPPAAPGAGGSSSLGGRT